MLTQFNKPKRHKSPKSHKPREPREEITLESVVNRITPRHIHEETRWVDIMEGIRQSRESGFPVSVEWIQELGELTTRILKHAERSGKSKVLLK